MNTKPDYGEESYQGLGRLTGRAAVITGGDSGIGRAIAFAFAREGADVLFTSLPDEEQDANETAQWIEKAGRKAVKIPGYPCNRFSPFSLSLSELRGSGLCPGME